MSVHIYNKLLKKKLTQTQYNEIIQFDKINGDRANEIVLKEKLNFIPILFDFTEESLDVPRCLDLFELTRVDTR